MPKTLLIIGNGFTKDLLKHIDLQIDTSLPFSFNVPNPFNQSEKLLDTLTHVKDLAETNPGESDFDKIESFLKNYNENEEKKQVHSQLRHYLTIAYSALSLKIFESWKKNSQQIRPWRWENWIKKNYHELLGIVSLNYDTALEITLSKLAHRERLDIDYYRLGSIENFIPKTISLSGIPNHYEIRETKNYVRKGIPIFKPHGSCDFEFPSGAFHSMYPKSRFSTLTHHMNNFTINDRGMVDVILPYNLMKPRNQVDIVLPGEASKQTHLLWVKQGFQTIKDTANKADNCIIVGVSYQECDRPELDSIMDSLPQKAQKTLILPRSNPEFEKKLGVKHTTPEEFFQDFNDQRDHISLNTSYTKSGSPIVIGSICNDQN